MAVEKDTGDVMFVVGSVFGKVAGIGEGGIWDVATQAHLVATLMLTATLPYPPSTPLHSLTQPVLPAGCQVCDND